MKVVILAGGFGTRLSEETHRVPKPLINIGSKPLLWHIMKHYSRFGFDEFVICMGYKKEEVVDYFVNYALRQGNLKIDLSNGDITNLTPSHENWKIELIDTGLETMTGGRLARIKKLLGNEAFFMTYGDGLCNVNIQSTLDFHLEHGKYATVTAVRPPGRFGVLNVDASGKVDKFSEKPDGEFGWINGGYFVLDPAIFDYIEGDRTVWEEKPLKLIAAAGQLKAYKHKGFWKPCDTLRDKNQLEELAALPHPPWTL